MEVELIPVIEVNYYPEAIPMPEKGPYWEYENDWEEYRLRCFQEAQLNTRMEAIKKGSPLFRINSIPKENIPKIIKKHFQEMFDEDEITTEEILSLDGGYVLRINGNDELFPQCCGTLKDIKEWKNICDGKDDFWIGHPYPNIIQKGDEITLECLEEFVPPAKNEIEINRANLKEAISKAEYELNEFSTRLNEFKSIYDIENLGEKLIFG